MSMRLKMRLEEAMVYVLAGAGRGMTTEQLAREMTERSLHVRADGHPISSAQVYAAVRRNPAVFVKEQGLIRLAM